MNKGIWAIVSIAVLAGVIGAHILPKHAARPRGSPVEAIPPTSTGAQQERLALEFLPIGEQR